MLYKGVDLFCPRCRSELDYHGPGKESLVCVGCESTYRIVLGIPDFRVFPDPYIDQEADIAKGVELAGHLDEYDFKGLVNYYYQKTQVVPPQHAAAYTRSIMAGEVRSRTTLNVWEAGLNPQDLDRLRFLEIGCGTGPLIQAAAAVYHQVVGIDIAFRWLIVARKRLLDAGLDLPLICACAEALPFRDQSFDRVAAESAIEHVKDQCQVMAEAKRVLSPAGRVMISAPNRLSIGPDPQVGIWGGGYLPEQWIARIVMRQGGIPPQRQLVSAAQLTTLLQEAGFISPKFSLMQIPEDQRAQFGVGMQKMIDLYRFISRVPILQSALLRFGPLFYSVAEKPS